jgi:CheY-like chemotaxis protein
LKLTDTDLHVAKRILVVDDRNELLHLMRRVLEDEEYQVSVLQEGRDAFARVKDWLPDLLILDLKLGDISGQEVLKQVKNDPVTGDIPVIVYTAAVLEADEVNSLIAQDPQLYDGVCLLRKPFELSTLLDRVEELLSKKTASER